MLNIPNHGYSYDKEPEDMIITSDFWESLYQHFINMPLLSSAIPIGKNILYKKLEDNRFSIIYCDLRYNDDAEWKEIIIDRLGDDQFYLLYFKWGTDTRWLLHEIPYREAGLVFGYLHECEKILKKEMKDNNFEFNTIDSGDDYSRISCVANIV